MFSNWGNDWHVEQLKNAIAGRWEKMAYIERQKQSQSGASKKPFKELHVYSWSASGYARGLRGWILDHVTAIHAVEFSAFHPAGFRR